MLGENSMALTSWKTVYLSTLSVVSNTDYPNVTGSYYYNFMVSFKYM